MLPTLLPGEALSVSNHTARSDVACLRAPPPGGSTGGLPSWALPAAVVLTAGDAASSLIDPAMPFIAAGALVATVATGQLMLRCWHVPLAGICSCMPSGLPCCSGIVGR